MSADGPIFTVRQGEAGLLDSYRSLALGANYVINFEDGRPSQEEMEALIREGISRPVQHPAPMPPMGGGSLSDEEVTQVARYVLSLTAEDSLD